jgi:alkane 1-monooxygenase
MLHDIRYLGAYLIPICTFIGIFLRGPWTYAGVGFAFVVIPIVELILGATNSSVEPTERNRRLPDDWFDVLLYINIPIVYTAVWMLGNLTAKQTLSPFEMTGLVLSTGVLLGANGINVGHELGHRGNPVQRMLGKMLLIPSIYMHFHIEHNRGHHHNVGTPSDPATARKNELLFIFWFRSQIGSYFQAWQIEKERLSIQKISFLHYTNRMIIYTLLHIALLSSIFFIFGFKVLVAFILAAVIGILLLETVNYIEHYGLVRQQKENGTYERVRRWHSWNSNHVLGRIVLFELSRHSDHHYKADRPYQLLESHEESPTMPTGYPGMMLLAVVPPLFFKVMNNRVDATRNAVSG